MLLIGNIETDPTRPEFVFADFVVISVSEFSNNALKPLPSADRFFTLELIVEFNYFVFVTDIC